MNNRIRELAEQAGFVDYTVHNRLESKEQVLAKFAELLVKETIDELIQQMWNNGIDESNHPQFYKSIDATVTYFGASDEHS